MKLYFDDIKISEGFANSFPSETKLAECREYYSIYGKLDREIVIDFDKHIIDGYIGYLILRENGFSGEIKVKQSARRKKRWYQKGTKVSYKCHTRKFLLSTYLGNTMRMEKNLCGVFLNQRESNLQGVQ